MINPPWSVCVGYGGFFCSEGSEVCYPVAMSFFSTSLVRYGIVGTLGTALDAVIFWLLYMELGWSYLLSGAVAFGIAFLSNFFLNKYWTFGNRTQRTTRQLIKSLIVAMGGLLITLIILAIGIESFGLNPLLVKLMASGVTFVWNFLGNKLWTFRERSLPQPTLSDGRSLDIVIPMYNESNRIISTLTQLEEVTADIDQLHSIILVDDGSTDETVALVLQYIEQSDLPLELVQCEHAGKGSAVRAGLKYAQAELALVMDADLATPLTELPKLMHRLTDTTGMVMGSRFLGESVRAQRQGKSREQMGRLGNVMIRWMNDLQYPDTQCGFKLYRREVAHAVAHLQRLDGFAYDVEHIVLIEMMSLEVAEVPVEWHHQVGSRVRPVRDAGRTFLQLVILKLYLWSGVYEREIIASQSQPKPL